MIFEAGARLCVLGDFLVQFLPCLVGENNPVLGIKEYDMFRERLDREGELLFRR